MSITRFAAIDIGSSSIKFLISHVIETNPPVFIKAADMRIPIRLGDDVFTMHNISEEKIRQIIISVAAFKNIMQVFAVDGYKACATAAMREAINSKYIVNKVFNDTGIHLEIISGSQEAEIIYLNNAVNIKGKNGSYMFIDVGGGSTEITLFPWDKVKISETFKTGTVRMLNNNVPAGETDKLTERIGRFMKKYPGTEIMASGGNINRLFSIAGIKEDRPLTYINLQKIYKNLLELNYEERVIKFRLTPDRADVIVQAASLFLHIMKYGKIKRLFVPKAGLSEGIIRQLYLDHRQNRHK